MRIKVLLLAVFLLFFSGNVGNVFADRNTATTTTYSSSQLIKRGEGLIYSISFVATANDGNFIIYDALAATDTGGSDLSEIIAEGKQACSGNGGFQNFADKPLEFSTGLYLYITSGYAIVSYE